MVKSVLELLKDEIWRHCGLWLVCATPDGLKSHPLGVKILLVASCCRNRDKLRHEEPLGLYVDFTFLPIA